MSETIEAPISDREDIRASIAAAVSEVDAARESPRTPTPEPEAPAAPEAQETEAQAAERVRDEKGRFAKAQEDAKAAETGEPAPPAEEAAAETPETPAETPKAEPPPTWTAADKEMFRKAPPEAQAFLLRRVGEMEAHFTHNNMRTAALRRDFEPVAQMFEPHREVMRAKNLTPAAIIKGYIELEGGLMDPQRAPGVLAEIAKGYKVPPHEVMRALGIRIPEPAPPPPTIGEDGNPIPVPMPAQIPPELMHVLDGVLNKVNTWEQAQAQEQQRQQAERQREMEIAATRVMSEIERFKNENGPDGQPLRPHFAAVEDDMVLLANAIRQKGGDVPPLAELYETAVWANPVTRARVQADHAAAQEAQRQAQEAKRQTEARAKAAKAQRAGAPVTGAPGTGHAEAAAGPANLRDDLRLAYAQHTS